AVAGQFLKERVLGRRIGKAGGVLRLNQARRLLCVPPLSTCQIPVRHERPRCATPFRLPAADLRASLTPRFYRPEPTNVYRDWARSRIGPCNRHFGTGWPGLDHGWTNRKPRRASLSP